MTNDIIITGLKNDDHNVLKSLYASYRHDFFRFAKKYPITEDDIKDIFQDAIIVLRNNAKSGKLDTLGSEVKTYLFSIGKYMIFSLLRKQKKTYAIEDIQKSKVDGIDYMDLSVFKNPLSPQQESLRYCLNKLEPQCQKILNLFYYRGFNISEITSTFNYNNDNVTKSQKSRCMKKLKELIKNNPHD